MARILSLALALVLAVAFAGCLKVEGNKDKYQEEPQVQGRSGNTSVEINR